MSTRLPVSADIVWQVFEAGFENLKRRFGGS